MSVAVRENGPFPDGELPESKTLTTISDKNGFPVDNMKMEQRIAYEKLIANAVKAKGEKVFKADRLRMDEGKWRVVDVYAPDQIKHVVAALPDAYRQVMSEDGPAASPAPTMLVSSLNNPMKIVLYNRTPQQIKEDTVAIRAFLAARRKEIASLPEKDQKAALGLLYRDIGDCLCSVSEEADESVKAKQRVKALEELEGLLDDEAADIDALICPPSPTDKE